MPLPRRPPRGTRMGKLRWMESHTRPLSLLFIYCRSTLNLNSNGIVCGRVVSGLDSLFGWMLEANWLLLHPQHLRSSPVNRLLTATYDTYLSLAAVHVAIIMPRVAHVHVIRYGNMAPTV